MMIFEGSSLSDEPLLDLLMMRSPFRFESKGQRMSAFVCVCVLTQGPQTYHSCRHSSTAYDPRTAVRFIDASSQPRVDQRIASTADPLMDRLASDALVDMASSGRSSAVDRGMMRMTGIIACCTRVYCLLASSCCTVVARSIHRPLAVDGWRQFLSTTAFARVELDRLVKGSIQVQISLGHDV